MNNEYKGLSDSFAEQLKEADILRQRLADAPQPPPMVPPPDYGTADYVRLPEFGSSHYSLSDAALVAALDMWASDKVSGVPCDGALYERDGPELRKALEPLRSQLVAELARSVEAGQLAAEVRARNPSDSRPIPERTFIHLQDLVGWLEVQHAHECGDVIEDIEELHDRDPWRLASLVAEARARLRHPLPDRNQNGGAAKTGDDVAEHVKSLERDLEAARLHIAHLETLKAGGLGFVGDDKRAITRQRRTLLTVIAALCQKARIDPAGRGAAMAIASMTEDLGAPVSDDSIRAMLRDIPDAIENRSS